MPLKKIDYYRIPAIRRASKRILKQNNKQKFSFHNTGNEISNNVKMNSFTHFLLKSVDIFNPVIRKHPKLGEIITSSIEKLIKLFGKVR